MILHLRSKFEDGYTAGILTVGQTEFHTLERPWIHLPGTKGGQPFVSCVPGGRYRLIPHSSHKFGQTWALVNHDLDVYHAPGDREHDGQRYAVLIHAANHVADLSGCIGVGTSSAPNWIGSSQKAMRVLRQILPHVEHTLDIDRYPSHRGTAL